MKLAVAAVAVALIGLAVLLGLAWFSWATAR